MVRPVLALCAVSLFAQPKPFVATAKLGAPFVVGHETRMDATTKIETGTLREVTLQSAELELTFPNRHENVVATAAEKLLILRGTVRNPEKTTTDHLSASSVVGLRVWQRYTGAGKFTFVGHYDPETLGHIRAELKPGASAPFIGVWRIPADLTDFRFGLTYQRPVKVAWYDLGPVIGKIRSAYATPDGLAANPSVTAAPGATVDVDGLELRVEGVSEPNVFAGEPRDASKRRYVVAVTVTNRQLLPARWGWQYLTAELLDAGGALKSYPDIIDRATMRSWAGDLNAGASMQAAFVFYSPTPLVPRALRLTFNASGRSLSAPF